jgi:hypothetical protein
MVVWSAGSLSALLDWYRIVPGSPKQIVVPQASKIPSLEEVTDGSHALLPEGARGTGKTSLWRRILTAAAAREYPILRAAPTTADARNGAAAFIESRDPGS